MIVEGLGVAEAKDPKRVDISKMPPEYPYKVPRLIRMTAKEFAGAFYEGMQSFTPASAAGDMAPKAYAERRTEQFRAYWKSQKLYVAWCWPLFVKDAHTTLVKMLADRTVSQHQKDEIYDTVIQNFDIRAFDPLVAQMVRKLSRM